MADKDGDSEVLKAMLRKYDRIYNPVANAEALAERTRRISDKYKQHPDERANSPENY